MDNYPPYSITDKMLNYVSSIMEKIGEANYFESLNRYPELRRKSRIRSIHSSLAIENNQLSLFQVEDVINGKMVIGEQKDIQEVKNAYKAYEELYNVNPYSVDDLKKLHEIMTFLVQDDNGRFRNHGEAVYDGDKMIFMAPPENMVPELMDNLFSWMNSAKEEVNPLILSSIFHYEFVFIHPFTDGNGRMARLWQTAILANWKDLFKYMPIESIIRKHQDEYYAAIANCNNAGNSNEFIEFMLKVIDEAVESMAKESRKNEINNILGEKAKGLNKTEIQVVEVINEKGQAGTTEISVAIEKSDRTVRRILASLEEKEIVISDSSSKNDSNRKYKIKMSE